MKTVTFLPKDLINSILKSGSVKSAILYIFKQSSWTVLLLHFMNWLNIVDEWPRKIYDI